MSSTTSDSAPEEPGMFSMPSAVVPFLQILGWDGALPLLTALGPAVIRSLWPQPPWPASLFLVFAPPTAALIRTQIGWEQIAKRCGGRAPWLRQIAMAAAIVLLLAFEIVVSVLTFAKDLPASAWWFPVAFYAGYLVMVSFALRPSRESTRCSSDASR
jgi:hypothetical protein